MSPAAPTTTTYPITVSFAISSGLPQDATVQELQMVIEGNAITFTGVYVPCNCVPEFPDAVHDVEFSLPILAAGDYVVTLRLKADSSYSNPPPVHTASGFVNAGLMVQAEVHVAQGIGQVISVVEYYLPVIDHYFMTADPNEIALLDAHQPPFEEWQRTGYSFLGYAVNDAPAATKALCRFYNDSFSGKSSHFYALMGLGCEETEAQFPDWKLETPTALMAYLPNIDGTCAGGVPVYRFYNNGMGGAPNHRFTISPDVRKTMLNQGWIPEGLGDGVAMCAAPFAH